MRPITKQTSSHDTNDRARKQCQKDPQICKRKNAGKIRSMSKNPYPKNSNTSKEKLTTFISMSVLRVSTHQRRHISKRDIYVKRNWHTEVHLDAASYFVAFGSLFARGCCEHWQRIFHLNVQKESIDTVKRASIFWTELHIYSERSPISMTSISQLPAATSPVVSAPPALRCGWGGEEREESSAGDPEDNACESVWVLVMCVSLSIRFGILRIWAHDLRVVSGILKTSQCRTDFESRGSNLVPNQRVGTGRFRDTIFSGWVPARRLNLVCN